ncbi:hypothetical protein [Dyadobacter psychrophilus]|uniref:Uncharacterized protein n=1 Tax=Dyadobacter psychrophilus TaxID=651661 RepID=A0A1T5DSY0_9BACT|nr:hypothetical protein [Dyadobacter psychrophilus]SKB74804.1 hypothetical protein SAMN05660293_01877 [Dyadobacter psychrophilus]
MEVGTIKAVHIYIHEEKYVTAELELNVKGANYSFGGTSTFLSGPQGGDAGDAPYLARFIFRCMQICGVETFESLKSHKVLAHIVDGEVIAIANVAGQNWFNVRQEFDTIRKEKLTNSGHSNLIL